MDKRMEEIGIDHGWANVKTATQIFTTGIKEITTEPTFFDNVLEWNHSYYKVGEGWIDDAVKFWEEQ